MIVDALLAATLLTVGVAASAGALLARSRAVALTAAGAGLVVVLDVTPTTAVVSLGPVAASTAPALLVLLTQALAGSGTAVRLALVGALLAGPVHLALTDPFRDPACRLQCNPNPYVVLVRPDAAQAAEIVGRGLLVACLVWLSLRRWRRAPLAAVALAVVGVSATRSFTAPSPLFFAAGVVAVAIVVEIVRTSTRRARLQSALADLGGSQDAAQALVGIAPEVDLGFRVPGAPGWIGRDGAPVPALVTPATSVVLRSPEGPIALVHAASGRPDLVALASSFKGPSRLALDNARFEAAVAFHERAILSSCRQLVLMADEERCRIERDLHDGAQQQVLSLGMRIGLRAAEATGAAERARLEQARGLVSSVLEQLREIAHGIHAASLSRGLAHALEVLGYRSPVPLEVDELPSGQTDALVALAVFGLVEETVFGAGGPVRVSVCEDDDGLHVTLTVEGELAPPVRSRDRVRALGGVLRLREVGGGWAIESSLPRRERAAAAAATR